MAFAKAELAAGTGGCHQRGLLFRLSLRRDLKGPSGKGPLCVRLASIVRCHKSETFHTDDHGLTQGRSGAPSN
jgi:hypothetical protein